MTKQQAQELIVRTVTSCGVEADDAEQIAERLVEVLPLNISPQVEPREESAQARGTVGGLSLGEKKK